MAEETVVEVVEEAVDHLTPLNLNGTTKAQQATVLVMAGVVGAAAGAAITYFVVRQKLKVHFEEVANEEILEAKRFYTELHKEGDLSDPEEIVKEKGYAQVVEREGYAGHPALAPIPDEENEPVVEKGVTVTRTRVTNIFEETEEDDLFTEDGLSVHRSDDAPYVITQEAYMENEIDYEQYGLTYYEGDEILVDERDEVIPDTQGTVGDENLLKFGMGTNNAHIVYVRNPVRKADFEIVRHEGKYEEVVMGFKHEDRTPRKFRLRGVDE